MAVTGIVDKRYAIEREIGRGGMATVYLARDLRHDSLVAVKVLSHDLAGLVSGERFSREIRITAKLQHPHILPVFDSGQVDGLPYYVMPFIDGPTIEQRTKAEGPLPVEEALEIAAEVASALDHAHAKGIVHRDIKPSNILLAHGHAVVADFGIARAVEPLTQQQLTGTGIAVGTAAYMSPEQASGEEVDGRSDIYSLGCVLFEMLAGHPPYLGPTPRATMAKHWKEEVPSLQELRPSIGTAVEELVRKAMAKLPENRFASGAELEEAIQRAGTEEKFASDEWADVARSSSGPYHPAVGRGTHAWSRINWRGFGLGAITVLLLAFGAWRFTRPRAAALDPNRVMIYPLIVPADFAGSRSVGEDISTMIGTALDGAGDLRWLDGWSLLTPAVRQDIRNLSAEDARRFARSRRAAYYMMGRIVVRGDSSEVFLELTDVAGDSTVARGRAIGPSADAWRTGLQAVNPILPRLIPSSTSDAGLLAEWTDRDPTAVAAFLLGESAFRRVHLTEALEHYRNALKADSTFALAAIRGAQVATWNHRPDEAASFIDAASRQPLSRRYATFARGYQAYLEGAADSAASEFGRLTRLDPEMAAGWMQLGEVYTHLLPGAGNPDSLARAAFDEAYRLDPAAKSVLFHSIEIRVRQRDTQSALAMLRDFRGANPDSLLIRQASLTYDCAARGPRAIRWLEAVRAHPLAVLGAASALKGGGAHLACAEAAFKAIIASDTTASGAGRQWSAIVGLTSTLLAQNRLNDASAVIDSSLARGLNGGLIYLMAAPLFPGLRAAAEATAQRDRESYGENYEELAHKLRLWQLGVWEALHGRSTAASSIASDLTSRARESGTAPDRRMARSMTAFAALSRGDTAFALRTLRSVLSEPVPSSEIAWDMAAPRGLERLILARLMVARKDFRNAIAVANVFDAAWPSVYLLYVPASLEVRVAAASAVSEERMASHFRRRLAALRGERAVAGK